MIHNDLKKVLAQLKRLKNFEEFLKSEEFENLLLENSDDEFWEQHISYTGFLGMQEHNRTYVNCLNYLLMLWLNNNAYEHVGKEINHFLTYTIEGYIEFNQAKKDLSQLFDALDFGPVTKETLKRLGTKNGLTMLNEKKDEIKLDTVKEVEHFDYAIITALEDDEMEKILEVAKIEAVIENETYHLRKGHFNSNPSKKILFASQNFSGFVDSAILTAEIISKYNVKLIIMPGVLGGNPNKTNFGDVIVANKVFTIDKGKIEEGNFNSEIESSNITHNLINKIKANKQKIADYIRDSHSENKTVDIYFEPIACVRHVISKKGYFLENISSIDRKAYCVEMESYGVVRATELANDGKTKVLIIKSVMDKTENKGDNFKKFASFTSARTVEFLFKENIV